MSRPRAPGHHDVEDQQVVAGVLAAELRVGVLAVDGEGDVEALLAERVADGVAHRWLVVCDQDPVAHRARSRYRGRRRALRRHARCTQKVRPPPPRFDSELATHDVDHSPCDREAETEALLLERARAAIEALEDALDLIGRDPGAGVGDLDPYLVDAARERAQGDLARRAGCS